MLVAMEYDLWSLIIGSGVTLLVGMVTPWLRDSWESKRRAAEDKRQAEAAQQELERQIYKDTAEEFVRQIQHLRGDPSLWDGSNDPTHFDEQWAVEEVRLRHQVDQITDSAARARLKAVIDSVVNDVVQDNRWVMHAGDHRVAMLELGRELCMAAARKQEPDPETQRNMDELTSAREYAYREELEQRAAMKREAMPSTETAT